MSIFTVAHSHQTHLGYPAFHSKHGVQSATYDAIGFAFNPGRRELTQAKMNTPLNIRWSRTIPKSAKVTSVAVVSDSAGRYFASLLCDDEVESLPESGNQICINMGLQYFLITSDGEKVAAPQFSKKHEVKLKKLQRLAARKFEVAKLNAGIPKGKAIPKGTKIPKSQNWQKVKLKISRIHAKIADSRRVFQHKLSTRLIRENKQSV